ncbi:hypothetical protein CA51_00980 [Rosistilla oblonga]|uniref:Uncharacterized protein n=1 Tax=Rosistilla oblonga TaxID=2527990 RepID=A0A518IM54_9BACT|nr:hypothetical protein CA51_00980 [Rosistilla oblonga]QDV54155.1 hypothetical protein Mal33_01010 [Rosistilla oblonga]
MRLYAALGQHGVAQYTILGEEKTVVRHGN